MIAKANKYNIQEEEEEEALAEIINTANAYMKLLFSSLKSSPNLLFSKHSFFFPCSHSLY